MQLSKHCNEERRTDYCYRGAIENILTGNITNWHGMHITQDQRALQPLIKTITDNQLLCISEVKCMCRAQRILKENPHLIHSLLTCCHLARSAAVTPNAVLPRVVEQ